MVIYNTHKMNELDSEKIDDLFPDDSISFYFNLQDLFRK